MYSVVFQICEEIVNTQLFNYLYSDHVECRILGLTWDFEWITSNRILTSPYRAWLRMPSKCFLTFLPDCFSACLLTFLPSCLSACLPVTCLLACLLKTPQTPKNAAVTLLDPFWVLYCIKLMDGQKDRDPRIRPLGLLSESKMFWIFVHGKLYRLSRKIILMLVVVTLVLLRMQWAACSHLTLAMRWCSYWPLITCGDRVTNTISPTYWPQVAQMMLHFQQQEWSPQYFFLKKTLNVLCITWHYITPTSFFFSLGAPRLW